MPILFGTAVPVDAGWTFAPIVLIALAAYAAIYVQRWRVSRAGGRSAGGALQQARAVDHRHRAAVRRADLAGRPPRRAVRVLPHGPAPDPRRPRADLPDARADQAHPAPGHPPHPVDRTQVRAVRAPRVRRDRVRRRHVDVAHPGHVRGRARALVHPRARAPDLRRRRPPLLVAPAEPDPLADAPRRPRPGALHGEHEDRRRPARHRARVRPARPVRLLRDRRHPLGPVARSTTSTSPAC